MERILAALLAVAPLVASAADGEANLIAIPALAALGFTDRTAVVQALSRHEDTAPVAAPAAPSPRPVEWIDGRRYERAGGRLVDVQGRRWRPVQALLSAYVPRREECDDDPGVTATGTDAFRQAGIAADPRAIAYRSLVRVPGYGEARVDDTGGDMRRDWDRGIVHLDLRIPLRAPDGRWRSEAECVRIARAHGIRHATVLVLDR